MTAEQTQLLVRAFEEQLQGQAESHALDKPGRYRFHITAPRFETMTHLERQDEAWEIVDRILPREATLDVSMILAIAPSDLAPA